LPGGESLSFSRPAFGHTSIATTALKNIHSVFRCKDQEKNMKLLLIRTTLLLALFATPAFAQAPVGEDPHHPSQSATQAPSETQPVTQEKTTPQTQEKAETGQTPQAGMMSGPMMQGQMQAMMKMMEGMMQMMQTRQTPNQMQSRAMEGCPMQSDQPDQMRPGSKPTDQMHGMMRMMHGMMQMMQPGQMRSRQMGSDSAQSNPMQSDQMRGMGQMMQGMMQMMQSMQRQMQPAPGSQ
jgi:hypothetical protein